MFLCWPRCHACDEPDEHGCEKVRSCKVVAQTNGVVISAKLLRSTLCIACNRKEIMGGETRKL